MKKLITLVAAVAMVLGSLGAASAIDVKVNGQFWAWAGYASNPMLQDSQETENHGDRFNARQRVRVQIQFIADENLSALLNFENNIQWGDSSYTLNKGPNQSYGALNADGTTFVVKRAHLDWTVPGTQVKTRIGVQGISLPGFAFTSPVLNADVAGVSVSSQFTPNIGMTAFWARPYNGGDTNDVDVNTYDEMDILGVILPIKTDVIAVTPWAMVASIGRDSDFYRLGAADLPAFGNAALGGINGQQNYNGSGLTAANRADFDGQTFGYWGGLSFQLPVLDPFFVKVDAMYGAVDTGDSDYDMSGWYVGADMGYKFSFGSLSAIGFYSSGNDGDDDYGQLPSISADGAFNTASGGLYGLAGTEWRRYDGYLSSAAGQGMWGLGFRLADVSFVNNLKHTLLGMYYGGTNDGENVLRAGSHGRSVATGVTNLSRKMATDDHAWELTLINTYKVNDNLSFRLDVGYIQLELGDSWTDKDDTKGNFITGVGVYYSF